MDVAAKTESSKTHATTHQLNYSFKFNKLETPKNQHVNLLSAATSVVEKIRFHLPIFQQAFVFKQKSPQACEYLRAFSAPSAQQEDSGH